MKNVENGEWVDFGALACGFWGPTGNLDRLEIVLVLEPETARVCWQFAGNSLVQMAG